MLKPLFDSELATIVGINFLSRKRWGLKAVPTF